MNRGHTCYNCVFISDARMYDSEDRYFCRRFPKPAEKNLKG